MNEATRRTVAVLGVLACVAGVGYWLFAVVLARQLFEEVEVWVADIVSGKAMRYEQMQQDPQSGAVTYTGVAFDLGSAKDAVTIRELTVAGNAEHLLRLRLSGLALDFDNNSFAVRGSLDALTISNLKLAAAADVWTAVKNRSEAELIAAVGALSMGGVAAEGFQLQGEENGDQASLGFAGLELGPVVNGVFFNVALDGLSGTSAAPRRAFANGRLQAGRLQAANFDLPALLSAVDSRRVAGAYAARLSGLSSLTLQDVDFVSEHGSAQLGSLDVSMNDGTAENLQFEGLQLAGRYEARLAAGFGRLRGLNLGHLAAGYRQGLPGLLGLQELLLEDVTATYGRLGGRELQLAKFALSELSVADGVADSGTFDLSAVVPLYAAAATHNPVAADRLEEIVGAEVLSVRSFGSFAHDADRGLLDVKFNVAAADQGSLVLDLQLAGVDLQALAHRDDAERLQLGLQSLNARYDDDGLAVAAIAELDSPEDALELVLARVQSALNNQPEQAGQAAQAVTEFFNSPERLSLQAVVQEPIRIGEVFKRLRAGDPLPEGVSVIIAGS